MLATKNKYDDPKSHLTQEVARITANDLMRHFLTRSVMKRQAEFCLSGNGRKKFEAVTTGKARKHIALCLNCREELRKICNEITELIRPRTTKELG